MRVLIAPDSFKGSLSAPAAAEALARGWHRARPDDELVILPLADGGEGTVEALMAALGGEWRTTRVHGPLGQAVDARWALLGDGGTALVEMAAASGLMLVPEDQRNPLRTSTFGTGELLRAALDAGARTVLMGIGGSATNDGGAGMAQALGFRLIRSDGSTLGHPAAGEDLEYIASLDASRVPAGLRQARLRVACDVDNPLHGPEGAAHVYGPQKGATPEMVRQLDAGLRAWARAVEKHTGRNHAEVPGTGAAGGLGFALHALCGAELVPGIDMVLDATRFAGKARGAGLVITGEGKIDSQTMRGKTIAGVVRRAREAGVPVRAFAGKLEVEQLEGVEGLYEIRRHCTSDREAMDRAGEILEQLAERAAASL